MRLRICVYRHELPAVKVLIKAPDEQPTPISKLLEQINVLVPLESEGWGLEDYVVTVQGYECLHYIDLHSILNDNDEVSVRALQTNDIKARKVSGRMQISNNGVHLLDGIPFGRQAIRRPHRPNVYIPPLKRRRLTENDEEEVHVPFYGGQQDQLAIMAGTENTDSDDENEDYGMQGEHYAQMDEDVVEAASSRRKEHSGQPLRHRSRTSSARRTSVQFAEPVITSLQEFGELSHEDDEDDEEDDDADFTLEGDEENEESGSEEEQIVTSDSESASEEADDPIPHSTKTKLSRQGRPKDTSRPVKLAKAASPEPSSPESDSAADSSADSSNSSSDSSSDSSDDGEEPATHETNTPRQHAIVQSLAPTPVPTGSLPFQGKKQTQERNRRRKARKRLDYLKQVGKLHADATMADLRLFEAEERGDIPSKFEVYDRIEANRAPLANAAGPDTDSGSLQQVQTAIDVLHSNSPATNLHLLEHLLDLPSTNTGVQVPSSPSANDPPDEMPTTMASTEDTPTTLSTSPATRQSRLDVASSRRLLFGSLGVRAPRSKEEEDKLRTRFGDKINAKSKNGGSAQANSDAEAPEPEDDNDLSDAWKSRINLTAVECVEEGVILSAPPFPFRQRWDPQQQSRGKKRKRPSQVMSQAYDEDEEWAGLDYDDADPAAENLAPTKAASPELPDLPTDLSSYVRPSKEDCTRGAIIAFTRMEVSKATKWQPGISPLRTARIEDVEDDVLVLSLAKRDRPQVAYDERGGRMYDSLEMPAADGEDEGVIEAVFDELQDVYLLQRGSNIPPDSQSMVPDSVPADMPVDGSDAESAMDDEQGQNSQSETQSQSQKHRRIQNEGQGDDSQELQAAQHQLGTVSASDESNMVIEASA